MSSSVRKNHAIKPDYKGQKRFALVAGGGDIPMIVASHIAQNGPPPLVAMLKGEANDKLRIYPHFELSTAAIDKLVTRLKSEKINDLVIVGSVKSRPSWSEFRLNWRTLKFAGRIIAGLQSGDDVLLKHVVKGLESEGLTIHGVHDVMPDILAPNDIITTSKPSKQNLCSIQLGVKATEKLGELDAGQGCVIIGKRIVALEGAEGTDAMLTRVADLRKKGHLGKKRSGVLVKMCKPQQEKRVDMPTIGLLTIKNTINAGLEGIAVHGRNTLIVDMKSVIDAANAAGIFIIGTNGEKGELLP